MQLRFFVCILLCLFGATRSYAHQVDSVELEFLQPEGQWKFEGLLDISYMLPEIRGVEDAPPLLRKDVMAAPEAEKKRIHEASEMTMRRLFDLKFGGEPLSWEIRFPDFETDPLILPPEEGGWALARVEIIAKPQPGAGKLEVSWNDDLSSELIIIIEEGINIGLMSVSSGMSETILEKEADPVTGPKPQAKTPGKSALAESWIISGYRHVIPLGLDHLLFILGLFLLVPKWKPLLGQSLLFTVAHSITLALTIFGFLSLPTKLIEILIAASIAWIGIENLFLKRVTTHRLILITAFGLLHGMGFASVLGEKVDHLSGAQLALPLVAFNLGVELAQITVLIAAFLVLWPLKKWTKQVRIAGSVLVALAGLFWMVERILS